MRGSRLAAIVLALGLLAGCGGGEQVKVTEHQRAEVVTGDAQGNVTAKLVDALKPVKPSCARTRTVKKLTEVRCAGYDDASIHEITILTEDEQLIGLTDELWSRTDVPNYDNGNLDTSRWDHSRRLVATAFNDVMDLGLDLAELFPAPRAGVSREQHPGEWDVITWTHSSGEGARFSPTFRATLPRVKQVEEDLNAVGPAAAFRADALKEAASSAGWECSPYERGVCWGDGGTVGVKGKQGAELSWVVAGNVPAWPTDATADQALRAALPDGLADQIKQWATAQSSPAALGVVDGLVVTVEHYGSQVSTSRGQATRLRAGF
ncbi:MULTISPECIES: hypothetical protein [unclassified Luteococcus]|uniref:hypothetical protein n=1 Tax=unclassified Luteococcus TaxID=2639923 RepID=UPI00313DA4B6